MYLKVLGLPSVVVYYLTVNKDFLVFRVVGDKHSCENVVSKFTRLNEVVLAIFCKEEDTIQVGDY
ncbi:MAG: hypothetical protein IKV80_03800 [Bacteroidales bacterium]|nr:hypothetical protein [Bacteroidales bacterium]